MNVLLLTRYGRKGASSRLRFLQFIPYLASCGITITWQGLLDDDYLIRLYESRRPAYLRLTQSFVERLRALVRARHFDLIWIEAEIFPFLPPLAEMWLSAIDVPYAVDYDDALFHRYDRHENSVVRNLLGDKIDAVMRGASLVVAGNSYVADRARRAGAARVERLPTVVDLDRYPLTRHLGGDPFTVGWIGTPVTAGYLKEIVPVLRGIDELRLVALGARDLAIPGVEVQVRPWSETTESEEIGRFDVGIMPLPDSEWERGKCGYKLIQYMACGLPVVASPVGINQELVDDGENGFLATSPDEWRAALIELKTNAHLRKKMGERGRRRVEADYCTSVAAPRLAELLRAAAI